MHDEYVDLDELFDIELDELQHYGVKGMKWGIRKKRETTGRRRSKTQDNNSDSKKETKTTSFLERKVYGVAVRMAPREFKYKLRRFTNKVNEDTTILAEYAKMKVKKEGVLPTNPKALKAVESEGIEKHKKAVYDNLDKTDIKRLKTYTDSARYSRGVNGYLAIGEPKAYEKEAAQLKETLRKNSLDGETVYRSCNFKFSINGVAKKLDTMSEEELAESFGKMSRNFVGKATKENRVFSTSTSPLFAIDTWRSVNPTAASTYNTYMIINTKKCPGILADGRTSKGDKLVNTRSNQEAILAPNRLVYRKLEYDKKRKMFAITVDAE